MKRASALLTILMAVLAGVVVPATAAEVDLRMGPKYSTLEFRAYAGEANNVNLQGFGQTGFEWTLAYTWVDLGSPILNSRDIACVNGAFSAACVVQYTEAVDITLGDGNDRVDVSGNNELPTYVHCGPGYDKVVVSAGSAFEVVDPDCEYVVTVSP